MRYARLTACAVCCWTVLFQAATTRAQLENETPPLDKLDIRVEGGDWGGGSPQNIQKVCDSAAAELWRYFPGRPLHPIVVSRSQGSPIAFFNRGGNGEYRVRLNSQGTYWAQFSFQFAHEFCHILCGYRPDEQPNKWFEESICDMASLFAMRRMAETWKTAPPYPNWKDLAPHLKSYADKEIAKGRLPEGTTLAEWYREHAGQLYAESCQRSLNRIVSATLLPMFEQQPQRWETLAYLNAGQRFKSQSFAEYVQQWEYYVPPRHKDFVRKIAHKFNAEEYGTLRPSEAAHKSAGHKPAAGELSLQVKDGDWGGASVADVRAVLKSAADEFRANFTNKPGGTVNVVRGFNGPIISYRKSPHDPYQVHLDVAGQQWAQFAFQFASTGLCRIAINHDELRGADGKPHPYGWLHGSLCHLAAITTIDRMADSWKTDPPYPSWRSYATALADYAGKLKKDPKHQLPQGVTLADWYAEHRSALCNDGSIWDNNGVVAVALFPLFERTPAGWDAVGYLPAEPSATLAEYLSLWHGRVPQSSKAFVGEIAAALGADLQ